MAVPFVGLTGGLGAGKSTALSALERLGAATLSTDAVVHELYETDDVRDAVVGRWGEEVAPGGSVDRSAVARRAFATTDDRQWLEQLLWPKVGERVAAFREEALAADPPPRAAVVETPLLSRQLPQEEKARRATFTVRNDGTVDELEARLSELLGKLG
jgi:dephospho-CoA kinase